MNPLLQFIFSRRSVRKYTDQAIPDSMPTDLLEKKTRENRAIFSPNLFGGVITFFLIGYWRTDEAILFQFGGYWQSPRVYSFTGCPF